MRSYLPLFAFVHSSHHTNADDDDFEPPPVVAEAPKKQWELEDKEDWETAEPAVPFLVKFRYFFFFARVLQTLEIISLAL